MIASGIFLPDIIKNSRTLSKLPESEQSGSAIGKSFFSFLPNRGLEAMPCLALIRLMFPFKVFISPLWHMYLQG